MSPWGRQPPPRSGSHRGLPTAQMLLVFDLKRFEVAPLVILNAYRRFPNSILTVGTWIITGFTVVSLVTTVL